MTNSLNELRSVITWTDPSGFSGMTIRLAQLDLSAGSQTPWASRIKVDCSSDVGLPDMPYRDRLELLGIDSLKLHHLRFDLCMLFKIVKGMVCVDVLHHFQFASAPTLGHSYKLLTGKSRTDVHSNCFFVHVLPIWNS